MMKNGLVSLSLLFSVVNFSHASEQRAKVIYGEDNRKDVFASDNALYVELSKSTAAMISHSSLMRTRQENIVEVKGSSFGSSGMCTDERFYNQVAAARCSGFLVAPDLLVTAGHCVTGVSDCKNYAWVFDYKVSSDNQEKVTVPSQSVYTCKEIISRSLDYATSDDYALIRLTKSVTGREPLQVRKDGQVEVGTNLVVIGHPSGLPTKIADGASVRNNSLAKYFVANLDTYGGNSGSAVFDAETGIVEGILVRGEADFVMHPSKNCRISNRCTDVGCRGEDVTRITNIKELQNI